MQKSKLRKNSTSVNTGAVQRAFDGDSSALPSQGSQKHEIGLPQESSESSSSTVPSLASSSSSTPQTEAIDIGPKPIPSLPQVPEVDLGTHGPSLQLGMLGIGGYGTGSDDLGWSGDWPDYNDMPPPANRITDEPVKRSCCTSSVTPPQPESVVPKSRSCCGGKQAPDVSERHQHAFSIAPQVDYPISAPPSSANTQPFSMAASAFPPQQETLLFTEDQFGCLHEPDQSCRCGEGCQCLGCSMHPANRTTTDYVRYHMELAMRGWGDPAHLQMPPSTMLGATQPLALSTSGLQFPSFPDMILPSQSQHDPYSAATSPFTSNSFAPQWHYNHAQFATPTLEMSQFSFQPSTPYTATPADNTATRPRTSPQRRDEHGNPQQKGHARQLSMHDTKSHDHDSPSTEDDASTLSPSAFSVLQYNIPGCNDATGSCLCGDGCQCEGCLTHNGHSEDNVLNGASISTDTSSRDGTEPTITSNSLDHDLRLTVAHDDGNG